MVIDTSALLAMLLEEPEAEACRTALAGDDRRLISAATLFEAAIVVEARKGPEGARELDLFVHKADVTVVPVDADQVAEGRRAWRRFGRGRDTAGLNFGDLFAYALATTSGEPLLYKGLDFARTDISRVL